MPFPQFHLKRWYLELHVITSGTICGAGDGNSKESDGTVEKACVRRDHGSFSIAASLHSERRLNPGRSGSNFTQSDYELSELYLPLDHN